MFSVKILQPKKSCDPLLGRDPPVEKHWCRPIVFFQMVVKYLLLNIVQTLTPAAVDI